MRGYVGAPFHERLERLGFFKEEPIVDHPRVIFCESFGSIAGWYELQSAVHGCGVVNVTAVRGLLAEEHCLVAGHGVGQLAIRDGSGREARFIEWEKGTSGRVESRQPAPVDPAYLLPPLSFGGASIAES